MRYGPIDLMLFLGQYPKVWIGGLITAIVLAAAIGVVALMDGSASVRSRDQAAVQIRRRSPAEKKGLHATLPPLPTLPRGHQWPEGEAESWMNDQLAKHPLATPAQQKEV